MLIPLKESETRTVDIISDQYQLLSKVINLLSEHHALMNNEEFHIFK